MKKLLVFYFLTLGFALSAQFTTIGAPSIGYVNNNPRVNDAGLKMDSNTNSVITGDMKKCTALAWCHLPLNGNLHITSRFGKRRNPFGKKISERHSGLDLSAKSGTPIYAMLPGKVAYIGYDTRSGNYIKLQHGSFTVSYCHLIRKPDIKVGSRVIPGQIVAHVGSTGRSTGPHLHITLKKNGRVLDPAILLEYISEYQ